MSDSPPDLTADIDTVMLTLRKPTKIKRAFDAVPKPTKSVPENALPVWHKVGLDFKLPVPKMPTGKIMFSCGKAGENLRRFVYPDGPTEFNNMDPYCSELKKVEYTPTHDPHLALHFSRPSVRRHMVAIGATTPDGRALCRLADFNGYRKFLFYQYMDRVHQEIKKMQEHAEDTLALRRAERVTQRRYALFVRGERERARKERIALQRAEEIAEKKRLNNALSVLEQLLITLRFYATGSVQQIVAEAANTHKSTVCRAIHRISRALASLAPTYIFMPRNENEMSEISYEFYRLANFPRVIGAIDCTQIPIQSPGGTTAELYRNRKSVFSLNVQTVVDPRLKIRDIVCRWPGSVHDTTVYDNSCIKSRLDSGEFGNSAKEQQRKLKKRMRYLAEFKERQREECAARAREKEEQLKQRVAAAEEKELRRTVTLLRNWRKNEKKRIERLRLQKETKEKMIQEQANTKWQMRIEAENRKIAQENLLTKIYTDVMAQNTNERIRKAELYEYNNDLNYQQLKMINLKKVHGSPALLIRKMGLLFEETKRGSKGMSVALALGLADVAVNHALSVQGNPFLGMARARGRMELETNQPSGVLRLIEETIETAMMIFIRGHSIRLLCDVERHCYEHFRNLYSGPPKKRKPKLSRWFKVSEKLESEHSQPGGGDAKSETRPKPSFGGVRMIEPDEPMSDIELYPTRNRPPTPYPTMDEVAELAFLDRPDDIPSPTAIGASPLPEKEKMLEDMVRASNLMRRFITESALKRIHLETWKITMPPPRHSMEWVEAVEILAKLLINSQIEPYNVNLRRVADFLTRRVMHFLQVYIKEDRKMKKNPVPELKVEEEQIPEPQQPKEKSIKKKK